MRSPLVLKLALVVLAVMVATVEGGRDLYSKMHCGTADTVLASCLARARRKKQHVA